MRRQLLAITALLLTVPISAMADWSSPTKVNKINVGVNGMQATFVSLVGYTFTGCSSTSGGIIDLNNSNGNYKDLLATLLAAKMADRDVQVLHTGCSAGYGIIKEVVVL